MSPLNYLRAMAGRRKLATGGIVRYDPAKPIITPNHCYVQRPAPEHAPAYAKLTIRLGGPTPEDVRRMAEGLRLPVSAMPGPAKCEQQAQAAGRSPAAAETGCPCGVIYSRCYYPVTHAAPRR